MRHRRKGRVLGRHPKHRRAMLKNLAKSLILTADPYSDRHNADNVPKIPGRVVTTLQKAKEVRPLVEKCVTIACKGIKAADEAKQFATDAERGTEAWQKWRKSAKWVKWNNAMAPAVKARRRIVQMLSVTGDKDVKGYKRVVTVLFSDVAPNFLDRPGGYTRIVKLATPRLGDNGTQAIIEFVGNDRDRVKQKSEAPAFEDTAPVAEESGPTEEVSETPAEDETSEE